MGNSASEQDAIGVGKIRVSITTNFLRRWLNHKAYICKASECCGGEEVPSG